MTNQQFAYINHNPKVVRRAEIRGLCGRVEARTLINAGTPYEEIKYLVWFDKLKNRYWVSEKECV